MANPPQIVSWRFLRVINSNPRSLNCRYGLIRPSEGSFPVPCGMTLTTVCVQVNHGLASCSRDDEWMQPRCKNTPPPCALSWSETMQSGVDGMDGSGWAFICVYHLLTIHRLTLCSYLVSPIWKEKSRHQAHHSVFLLFSYISRAHSQDRARPWTPSSRH